MVELVPVDVRRRARDVVPLDDHPVAVVEVGDLSQQLGVGFRIYDVTKGLIFVHTPVSLKFRFIENLDPIL